MSVVEVEPAAFEQWGIKINGVPLPRTYASKAAAREHAERLAERRQAELRIHARNGDGSQTIRRFSRSPGY